MKSYLYFFFISIYWSIDRDRDKSVHTIVKLVPYFASMSGVTAIVKLPTGNHVELTNPPFLTVCVSIVTSEHPWK